jgi:cytochrome c
VAGGRDGALTLWRLADGEDVQRFIGHELGVTAVAPTSDGARIVSASIDGSVRLWDRMSGAEIARLQDSQHPLLSAAISRDGRLIAAGGIDGRILIWRLGDHRLVRAIDAIAEPIWAVAFDRAGAVLSGGGDGIVRRWSTEADDQITAAAAAPSPDDGSRGAALFRKCSACHTLTANGGNRAGPTLHRLFGRPAGAIRGYPYSEALRSSHVVWTEATVDELFRRGPQDFVPGSKMPLQRMPSAQDRADLIDYLKRSTEP